VKLPGYAEHLPRQRLVKILCRGTCGKTRYAEVSRTPWKREGGAVDRDLFATCLVCGYRARDNYNWTSV